MKLHSSCLSPSRKTATYRENSAKTLSTRLTPHSPISPYEAIEKIDASLESTFYKTFKERNGKVEKEKEDANLENLKNFVQTSSSLKSLRTPQSSSSVVFTSKDYLKNNNFLVSSLFEKELKDKKKTNKRASSSKIFSSFNKDDHSHSHGNTNLI